MSVASQAIRKAFVEAWQSAVHDGERGEILSALNDAIDVCFLCGRDGVPRTNIRRAHFRLRAALDDLVLNRVICPTPSVVTAEYTPTLTSRAATLDVMLAHEAAAKERALATLQAKRSPDR
jgi:hypothetical protein